MTELCPVCEDPVEHVRVETAGDPSTTTGASFDVEDLCSVTEDTRWDRICPVASVDPGGDQASPVLEVYYHFFADDE